MCISYLHRIPFVDSCCQFDLDTTILQGRRLWQDVCLRIVDLLIQCDLQTFVLFTRSALHALG